jgi:hypothetical protein
LEFISDDTIQLTLQNKSTTAEWIQRASGLADVADFRGGALSLHEIYLRALNPKQASSGVERSGALV